MLPNFGKLCPPVPPTLKFGNTFTVSPAWERARSCIGRGDWRAVTRHRMAGVSGGGHPWPYPTYGLRACRPVPALPARTASIRAKAPR